MLFKSTFGLEILSNVELLECAGIVNFLQNLIQTIKIMHNYNGSIKLTFYKQLNNITFSESSKCLLTFSNSSKIASSSTIAIFSLRDEDAHLIFIFA